ncbi:MAG: AAA family ATPase, partial [Natronosporangium sp.]
MLNRLAAVDVLHRDERLLRRGWGFLIGVTQVDGSRRRVRLPLLSEPVRLRQAGRGYRIEPAGDLELTPLVEVPELAASLEAAASAATAHWAAGGTGKGRQADQPSADWLRQVAAAAGLPVRQVWSEPPRTEDELVGVARAALFVARDVFSGSLRDSLLNWAGRDGLAGTALATLYGAGDDATDDRPTTEVGVRSPLPLTSAQTDVVRLARTERVSVVSGPPGNGKSHAVVAAALEVVDRGGSVLVATQSPHAADVLGELLERYPGPTPVRFGDAERRADVAAALSEGAGEGAGEGTLRADEQAVAAAAGRVGQL